jgi:hypothetical protein
MATENAVRALGRSGGHDGLLFDASVRRVQRVALRKNTAGIITRDPLRIGIL